MDELNAVRKIRACEGDAAAQVVLANYAKTAHSTGFRAGIEKAAKIVEAASNIGPGAKIDKRIKACEVAIRAIKVPE